jgi:hypothetical protein
MLQHLREHVALERLLVLHDGALVRALEQRRARRARVRHRGARLACHAEQLLGVTPARAPRVSAAPRIPYMRFARRGARHICQRC